MIKSPQEGFDKFVNKLALLMTLTCDPQETETLMSLKMVEDVLGLNRVEIEKAWSEAKKRVTTN